MENISMELAMISNLRNTALDHKKYCKHDCNVSLHMLKMTAKFIRDKMRARNLPKEELNQANTWISEIPLT